MSRTLSNGTLSLRFMQNAQRAKQLKEVELQRAEVVDEGKWEVSQAVRQAWGLGQGNYEEQEADVHEASYLPFLFANTTQDKTGDMPSVYGRRIFNKLGKDVSPMDNEPSTNDLPVPSASTSVLKTERSSTTIKGRIHAHPHPVSISTLGASRKTFLEGFDQLSGSGQDNDEKNRKLNKFKEKGKRKEKESISARQTIFDSGNVGVDLRARATVTTKEVYMKPLGIDEPKNMATPGSFPKGIKSEEFARQKTKSIKREHDGDEDGTRKKSKRKPDP